MKTSDCRQGTVLKARHLILYRGYNENLFSFCFFCVSAILGPILLILKLRPRKVCWQKCCISYEEEISCCRQDTVSKARHLILYHGYNSNPFSFWVILRLRLRKLCWQKCCICFEEDSMITLDRKYTLI